MGDKFLKKTEKEEKEKERKKTEFLELIEDLILLIDGYRIFRLKNYKSMDFRIRKEDAERRLRINWKKTYRILNKMSELPNLIPGVRKLKKIQIISSLIGAIQFCIAMAGFMLSTMGFISASVGPILLISFMIVSCIPLIGVYATNRIAVKVSDYYYSHPNKFNFKIAQLKEDVQTLLDLLREELKEVDEKTREKHRIMKLVNVDYKGIEVLKRPGRIRKLYWIRIMYN